MGTPPAASRQTGSNQYKAKLNINASKPAGQPGSNLLAQADRAGPDPAALQTAARRQVWEEIASIEPLSHPDQIADVAYRSTSCPDDIKARLLLSSTTLPSRRGTKQLVDWVLQLAEPGPDALVKLAKKYPEHTMDIRRHPQWDSQLERHIAQTPDSLQAERRELYEQLGSKLRNGILPEAFAELTPKQRRQILRLAPASTLLKLTSDIWIADPPDQQNPAHGYSIGPGGTTSTGVRQRPLELLTGPEIETVWGRYGGRENIGVVTQTILEFTLQQKACPPYLMDIALRTPQLAEFTASLPSCPRHLRAMWQLAQAGR